MKNFKFLTVIVLAAGLSFTGCKPKDADVKASIEKSLKENPATAGVSVMVEKGVATLNGEVADINARTEAEAKAKAVKGVDQVVNNTSTPVVAPVAPPVVIAADDPLQMSVRDAVKDHPTVQATVNNGIVTLTGSIKRTDLAKLMMTLNTLKPRKIENQLTIN